MLSACVAACGELAESFAVTLKKLVPAVVGVPLIAPELDSVSPAGSAPEAMLHTYGDVPPWAVSVALYAVPAVAPDSEAVVMDNGAGAGAATAMVSDRVVVCGEAAESFT